MSLFNHSQRDALFHRLITLQNAASRAVVDRQIGEAHRWLKESTILIFENAGAEKAWPLSFAVPLLFTLFRAASYLENDEGDLAYRYEAIPGQLGNACHFQLGLSSQDASGYSPAWSAKKECALAAHQLLATHSNWVFVQSKEERRLRVGRGYQRRDLIFETDDWGYPKIRIREQSQGRSVDFKKPRFLRAQDIDGSLTVSHGDWSGILRMIEGAMRDGD